MNRLRHAKGHLGLALVLALACLQGIGAEDKVVVKLRTATIVISSNGENGNASLAHHFRHELPLHRSDRRWKEVSLALTQLRLGSQDKSDIATSRSLLSSPDENAREQTWKTCAGEIRSEALHSLDKISKDWWKEPNAKQIFVSFNKDKDTSTDYVDVIESLLQDKGVLADFISEEAYLVVAKEGAIEDLRKVLQNVALVTEYSAEHKIAPELTTLLELLSTLNMSTSAPGIHMESVDISPTLGIEVASKNHGQSIKNSSKTKEFTSFEIMNTTMVDLLSESEKSPVPVKAFDIRIKGRHNATLDFFSVAVDQYNRILLSLSTPGIEGMSARSIVESVRLAIMNCCKGAIGDNLHSCQVMPPAVTTFDEEQSRQSLVFKLAIPPKKLEAIVYTVAHLPFVNWIEPELEARLYNHHASAILQSGSDKYDSEGARPFWAAGLTGTNQIVGVGDTGLDPLSCFFYDKDNEVGYNHYKIIGYRGFADYEDTSGHGTHVCGSIAGKTSDASYTSYNGMAPDAKLAFTDLGLSYGDQRGLIAPETMSNYYRYAYNLGARLHSDSWGGLSSAYTRSAREVDEYHFYHPEFLAMIAAGNDGEYLLSGDGVESTVSTPATCKNALAIGATKSLGQVYPPRDPIFNYQIVKNSDDSFKQDFKVVSALFSPEFAFNAEEDLPLVLADPIKACTPLNNESFYEGKIVLVERGDCFFTEKTDLLNAAGARGVIIYNNEESGAGFFKMASADDMYQTAIPTASVPLSMGRMLREAVNKSEDGTIYIKYLSKSDQRLPAFESIAEYSSFGPTRDGRVKPDVVAPGEAIKSATKSDRAGQCKTRRISGTSMATPLVAGIAALVRQWLMDNDFSPEGSVGLTENPGVPTGALIKAILINGAQGMQGYAQSGLPLEPPPSFRQGWGRVQLDQSLPLKDGSIGLQYVDWKSLDATGQTHEYCLSAPPGGPIQITLVWMDAPGSLSSGGTLVNDLDLEVANVTSSRDRKNNVEKVILNDPKEGTYTIRIVAHSIKWKMGNGRGQLYALAVNGPKGIRLLDNCLKTSDNQNEEKEAAVAGLD